MELALKRPHNKYKNKQTRVQLKKNQMILSNSANQLGQKLQCRRWIIKIQCANCSNRCYVKDGNGLKLIAKVATIADTSQISIEELGNAVIEDLTKLDKAPEN